jgi:hypothetical protein
VTGSFAATPDIVQGMKLVRYRSVSGERPGLILDGQIFDLSGSFAALSPRAPTLDDIKAIAAVPAKALAQVQKGTALGPPLRGIGKIIGVGLNYRDHAEETGLPLPKEPTLYVQCSQRCPLRANSGHCVSDKLSRFLVQAANWPSHYHRRSLRCRGEADACGANRRVCFGPKAELILV